MTRSDRSALVLTALVIGAWAAPSMAAEPAPTEEQVRFFESRVRPILADTCARCHGPRQSKAGLRLDSRAALLAGGDSGPAVVPGKPEESLIISAVRFEGPKMPPKQKLSSAQVTSLTEWVKMGAPWPGGHDSSASMPVRRGEFVITESDRAHWAFRPVTAPIPPKVGDSAWPINPIDAFILAKLESQGLRPNAPATKTELLRRATYDLTGLPPTPEEVDAFLGDTSPLAYEHVIDRLLASPRYGETWGRHWLDLVRFAETNSYERDDPKPNAWRYRDYVIRSLNRDKPYDRFVREQLAGDELPDADADSLTATGYYWLGIWDDEPTDREQAKFDGLDDIVATTGQVFLGLTIDCARCHDHKLDPIAQKDYYRLLAFFRNINDYTNGTPSDQLPVGFFDPAAKAAYAKAQAALDRRRDEARAAATALENQFRARFAEAHPGPDGKPRTLTDRDLHVAIPDEAPKLLGPKWLDRYNTLKRDLEALNAEKVLVDTTLSLSEAGSKSPETFVLLRGNAHVHGDRVEPGFPQVLGVGTPELPNPPPGARSCGRRLVLANWIASRDNPLASRVIVNRLWQHHFGRGIVRSPNNFGVQGDKPTHPELLDWLSVALVREDWHLKPLHRLLMTSQAYRMSSRANPEGLAKDPANDGFWRFDMRRLSAEEVRDTILAVAGTLNPAVYGRSIFPAIPAEVLHGQSKPGYGWVVSPIDEQRRRSVYIHIKRSLVMPIMESFDVAETDRSTPVRFATTQPTQALGMLNSQFLDEQAGALADRLRREAGDNVERQVALAVRLAAARPPKPSEIERGVALIASLKTGDHAGAHEALKAFCLVVMNLNEMIYLD
jgi:cytochrome c553